MNNKSFVFVGQVIPQEIFNQYFRELTGTADIAGNTFYTALLEGIAENGYHISAVSKIKNEVLTKIKKSKFKGVDYQFIPYSEKKYLRFIKLFIYGIKQIRDFYYVVKEKDKFAIFNVLRISSSLGGLFACKIFKIKTIAVVTDVPGFRIKKKKHSFIEMMADKIGRIILNKFDSYVLLSEAMKSIVNVEHKPYIIIEGIYEPLRGNINVSKFFSVKQFGDKFIIVYAGSLHYMYGVMNLVRAVEKMEEKDIRLIVYGSGEASDEISKISKKDKRIKFCGLVSREQLLCIEQEASLLVNPRPVEDLYVKYSFPSKNIEYMASGTPTLLTNIPSLPEEYKKHVILAENNSVDELYRKILGVYEKRESDYYKNIGIAAKKFIYTNKNKKNQVSKIIKMIDKIV